MIGALRIVDLMMVWTVFMLISEAMEGRMVKWSRLRKAMLVLFIAIVLATSANLHTTYF
jgi:hypothetical protein